MINEIHSVCNSAEKKYGNLAVILKNLSQLLGLLFLCNSSVVPTRPRALTKVKHTMGPIKGLQEGKLVC